MDQTATIASTSPGFDGQRRLEVRIQSHATQIARVRRAVERFAAEAGFPEKDRDDIGLCVNEAIANVIRHGYGGASHRPIVISAEFPTTLESTDQKSSPGRALCVTIRDWGSATNPADLATKPYDPLEPGGVGLICLQSLLDRVTYAPQHDGMLLTLWKVRKTP